MHNEAQVIINGTKEAVWQVITNIENASETISSIEKVEVLEKPQNGFVGFKWRETRTLFGKTAIETMWITDAEENRFYKTGAASHGFNYISTLSITEQESGVALTMTHDSKAQSLVAKLLAFPMGLLCKSAFTKAILKDLKDIKAVVEQSDERSN